MKKVWEVIKKVFCWLGAVFVAIFTVLFCREVVSTGSTTVDSKEDDKDEINRKASRKREEAVERISRADPRSICEGYGTVCDTIASEKKDSDDVAQELTIEEVMEIAEEEIERTAQEAVKAALVEVGGELAFEKERADQMEAAKLALEAENKKLKEEVQKKQNQFFYGALIGGAGGVVVTSLVFGLLMGACK